MTPTYNILDCYFAEAVVHGAITFSDESGRPQGGWLFPGLFLIVIWIESETQSTPCAEPFSLN